MPVIEKFTGDGSGETTTGPLEPNDVLKAATAVGLSTVVIVGMYPDGLYVAGSHSEAGPVLLMLERAKARLLAIVEEDNEKETSTLN